MDPLQVAMTGVRMGEKYLQILANDPTLTAGLAAKVGLSGMAALAAPDAAHERRGQAAGEKAGALIEIKQAQPNNLPWEPSTFDMVVIDNTAAEFARMSSADRQSYLVSAREVLRDGGRVELIERVGGGGFFGGAALPADYERNGGGEGALREAGFRPVRTLAEKDGFRFVEGLKG